MHSPKKATQAGATRPVRRFPRRTVGIAVAAVAVLVAGTAIALRSPSPVGHWDGAEGLETYLSAYDEEFERFPAPEETLDVRTDFGVVRVYRFAGVDRPGQDGEPESGESADGDRSGRDGEDTDGTEHGEPTAPLVLLPGRSSGSPVWTDNLPHLLPIADVYVLDLLGEPGRSVQERPITSDADQAAWLDQTLEGLAEDRFHLVGMSFGGWSAMNLARHATEHLASVTALDAPFAFDDLPLGTVIRSIPVSFSWAPQAWRESFSSYTAGGAEVQDLPVTRMIEAGMQHYSLKLPMPSRISEAEVSDLGVPVLALMAGRSVMHDPPTAIATAERTLGEDSVSVYPDASHAINGEYPEETAADIAQFVGGLR